MNRTEPLRRNLDVLPCIACGKLLESAVPPFDEDDPAQFQHQPYAALSFSTGGHYGSTLFDPGTNYRRIVISVCDQCVFNNLDRIAFLKRKTIDDTRNHWYWTEVVGEKKAEEFLHWTPPE